MGKIKRGLPSTISIKDVNLKRVIDALIEEIRRLQKEVDDLKKNVNR